MIKWLESAFAIFIALASIGIAIAGFFGFTKPFEDELPLITILLLGLLMGYIVIERFSRLDKLGSQAERLSENLTIISAFFEHLRAGDDFDRLLFYYGAKSHRKRVNGNQITGGEDEIFGLWRDALELSNSFLAHNRVRPDEVWATSWSFQIAQALQGAHVASGNSIRRLFIIDNQEELTKLAGLISKQLSIDIDVRIIFFDDYKAVVDHQALLDRVGTDDFVIVNSDIVFRVFMDEGRSMNSCDMVRDVSLVNHCQRAMREAWRKAQKPHEIETLKRSMASLETDPLEEM